MKSVKSSFTFCLGTMAVALILAIATISITATEASAQPVTESGYLSGPNKSKTFIVNAGSVDFVEVNFTFPNDGWDFYVKVEGRDEKVVLGKFKLKTTNKIHLGGGGTFYVTIYTNGMGGNWSATYDLNAGLPDSRMTGNGKYYNLLYILYLPDDKASYGETDDWGSYSGSYYQGYSNLPPGYWVYLYPYWYIWGNQR
jgi:hypothetical protein